MTLKPRDDIGSVFLKIFSHLRKIPQKSFTDQELKKNILFNIGTGKDISIKELAELIKSIINYSGDIVFDTSNPDETPQKLLAISAVKQLGWESRISMKNGIATTDFWYVKNLQPG